MAMRRLGKRLSLGKRITEPGKVFGKIRIFEQTHSGKAHKSKRWPDGIYVDQVRQKSPPQPRSS